MNVGSGTPDAVSRLLAYPLGIRLAPRSEGGTMNRPAPSLHRRRFGRRGQRRRVRLLRTSLSLRRRSARRWRLGSPAAAARIQVKRASPRVLAAARRRARRSMRRARSTSDTKSRDRKRMSSSAKTPGPHPRSTIRSGPSEGGRPLASRRQLRRHGRCTHSRPRVFCKPPPTLICPPTS
jgi:hypothetical protein